MKLLVTGATGHIGSHVVRAALTAGHTAIAFARPGSDRRALAGLDVEVREGDLLDETSVAAAMRGIDAVAHVGAVHRNLPADPAAMVRTAVGGTEAVLTAAARAGVRRVVVTSTAATIGFAADVDAPLDERHRLAQAHSPYVNAKLEQERAALALAERLGLEVVVVNPSGVFGPHDYRLTPAMRSLSGLLHGDPSFIGVCPTDVRDVARAHLLALERGTPGERYLVTGDRVRPGELALLVGELAGIWPSTFRPPQFLLRFVAARAEKQARAANTDAPITRELVADLAGGHLVYDSTRSRTELRATYRSARAVLRDAFRWLLHVGRLAPKVARRVEATLGAAAAADADWA